MRNMEYKKISNNNSGTPSVTIKLSANQTLYYGSSTAGDDINWLTKII
ncbi:hypothetical protein BMS3Abin17_00047 [archaeon BMS3Abin17]|nr:hypothetical protein BMS3Abin17_00047 [archaeon BMS3Abin17]